MLISVVYKGTPAPEGWTKIDRKASMAVLEFDEFVEFLKNNPGKRIIAIPEVEGYDGEKWRAFVRYYKSLGFCLASLI